VEGQTPLEIALMHGIDLETLYSLNGLNEDSLIHPGDQLLIRPGDPTPTPPLPPTATPSPPTHTPEPVVAPLSQTDSVEDDLATEESGILAGKWPYLIAALGGAGLVGVAVIIIRRRMSQQDDVGDEEEQTS
jgi:hypothetical protein